MGNKATQTPITSPSASSVPHHVAHVSDDNRYESVAAHLHEVAEMAASFAKPFHAESWAYAAGMAHDIGKYSEAFQNRILRNGPKVDHSTAGAFELREGVSGLLAYCVAGHHAGLPDGGTSVFDDGPELNSRLARAKNGKIPAYQEFLSDISLDRSGSLPIAINTSNLDEAVFAYSFFTRMVFSCLVDADFLCTERFMRGSARTLTPSDPLSVLRDKLETKLQEFYPPTNRLNTVRCSILDACLEAAACDPGVFCLTVPTGGGKTFAAMRFALNHACKSEHGHRRIIVAEPYTSIIEQNADVYRSVLGSNNVLEHHAHFDFDDQGEDGTSLRLASENWDMPVIVTTNVQLFESLYTNRPSRARKLHNIADSVIILDEAQMVPTKQLLPCIAALCELVKNYGCTVVLCTATQPAFNRFFEKRGLAVREIAPCVPSLFSSLRRTSFRAEGTLDNEELASHLACHDQALCIVNSRRQAREVFELVRTMNPSGSESVFHLTTLMRPVHRKRVLDTIRARVKAKLPCLVVATSLVEAGVDLDFPTVYRALAGIDSIIQAAGRCNREGERDPDSSIVHIFEAPDAYAGPAEIRQRAAIARSAAPAIAAVNGPSDLGDLGSPDTISRYFKYLYDIKGDDCLDKTGVFAMLSDARAIWCPDNRLLVHISIPFAQAAAHFNLIEDGAHPVIIPDETLQNELRRLEYGCATNADMRLLTQSTVNIYSADRNALLSAGAIKAIADNIYLLTDTTRYRDDIGLDLSVEQGRGIFL